MLKKYSKLIVLLLLLIPNSKKNQMIESNINVDKKVIILPKEEKIILKSQQKENVIYVDDNSFMTLVIPKINLKKSLYEINDKRNHVNKNIQILKESKMPDESGSNLILASHSGNSKVAFFNDLNQLVINDVVYIIYNNIQYTYKVYKMFDVDKDGQIIINTNGKDNYLTLITCKLGTNKQIVLFCKLDDKVII